VGEPKLAVFPQSTPRSQAVKEEDTTQKLVFALAVFALVSFAVWTGFAADVETPAPAATQASGMLTPF
jgi:hypothetical protein